MYEEWPSRLPHATAWRSLAPPGGWFNRIVPDGCLDIIWNGYGPKMLVRVLRLQRAVALARRGRAYADVSAAAGYADQAHLSREVKALAGVPLSVLRS